MARPTLAILPLWASARGASRASPQLLNDEEVLVSPVDQAIAPETRPAETEVPRETIGAYLGYLVQVSAAFNAVTIGLFRNIAKTPALVTVLIADVEADRDVGGIVAQRDLLILMPHWSKRPRQSILMRDALIVLVGRRYCTDYRGTGFLIVSAMRTQPGSFQPHGSSHFPSKRVSPMGKKSPYLTTAEAAQVLRLKQHTLDNMRWQGTGPKFRKHGGRIFYHRDDLRRWSDRSRRQSSSGSKR
jgi:hypothetical protein